MTGSGIVLAKDWMMNYRCCHYVAFNEDKVSNCSQIQKAYEIKTTPTPRLPRVNLTQRTYFLSFFKQFALLRVRNRVCQCHGKTRDLRSDSQE
jgi:hypothetical protein